VLVPASCRILFFISKHVNVRKKIWSWVPTGSETKKDYAGEDQQQFPQPDMLRTSEDEKDLRLNLMYYNSKYWIHIVVFWILTVYSLAVTGVSEEHSTSIFRVEICRLEELARLYGSVGRDVSPRFSGTASWVRSSTSVNSGGEKGPMKARILPYRGPICLPAIHIGLGRIALPCLLPWVLVFAFLQPSHIT
jgi:hypothetical protein